MALDTSFIEARRYRPEPMSEREAASLGAVTHEDYSVYTQRLTSACEEGKEILVRLGISEPLQSGDVCHSYYTAQGDLSLAELGTFLHAITGAVPIKFVLKYYQDDSTVGIQDGDIFFCNEAIYGGLHNPDQIVFMPVFWKGELISWVSSAGHEPETGATEPGGQPADARDRYAEGLKVPPVKIGDNFKLRRDMMEFFQNMVRYPEMIATDTAAKLAACLRLRARLLEIIERHGPDFIVGLLRKVIEDSAKAAKERISKLPDGEYRCVGFLDTYGPAEALLRVPCTLIKKGDRLIAEFAGGFTTVAGAVQRIRACGLCAPCVHAVSVFLLGFTGEFGNAGAFRGKMYQRNLPERRCAGSGIQRNGHGADRGECFHDVPDQGDVCIAGSGFTG